MKRLRGKLTYSNVMVTILAFVVLAGGTAYAATEMLPRNSVGTKQLKRETVTPAKLSAAAKLTLTGPKGATGPQGPKGETGTKGDKGEQGAPATDLWAFVDTSAPDFIKRGSGAVGATLGETGVYRVIFDRDVSACTWVATPAGSSATQGNVGGHPARGEVAVSALGGEPDGVVVSRYSDGTLADLPVTLAVFC
jgi:hypothetical protein